jgi:cytochrome c-type biogenesis protein CcmE
MNPSGIVPRRAGNPATVKFWIGGGLIVAAIIYLIASATSASAQYYLTIDELQARGSTLGDREIRVSGAVDGETIAYDSDTLTLRFAIAHVSGDLEDIEQAGGLAEALHAAVLNPSAARLEVEYIGPRPDLLRDEAQAIVTGRLGEDGVFHAEELLLKCPTRYEEDIPLQSGAG